MLPRPQAPRVAVVVANSGRELQSMLLLRHKAAAAPSTTLALVLLLVTILLGAALVLLWLRLRLLGLLALALGGGLGSAATLASVVLQEGRSRGKRSSAHRQDEATQW